MPDRPRPPRVAGRRREHVEMLEGERDSLVERYDLITPPDLRNLADGRLVHMPRGSHQICGRCDLPRPVCRCKGMTNPPCDMVYVDALPEPVPEATPMMMLNRWASLVEASAAMYAIKAKCYVADQGAVFCAAAEVCAETLDAMCSDYISGMDEDALHPHFLHVLGYGELPGLPPPPPAYATNGAAALAAEVLAAKQAFLAGDWATITRLGAVLLNNVFQASDPEKFSIEDAGLRALYDGVGLLGASMDAAFSDLGWRLALEYFRAPFHARGVPSAQARDFVKRRMRAASGEATPDDMSLVSQAMEERLRGAKGMLIT